MKRIYLSSILAILLCFYVLLPGQADAHRLNVFAWLENDQILVECNFGEKRPAANAAVTIVDDTDQKELLHGKTNAEGKYSFAVPDIIRQGHGLIISVNAGQGHVGEWAMNASELYAAAALTAGFDAAALKEKEQDHVHLRATPIQPGSVPMPGSQLDKEHMRSLLHAALEQHLAPIQRQLAAQSAKGPSMSEIIGGIGWIIGLVGTALYFKARKA